MMKESGGVGLLGRRRGDFCHSWSPPELRIAFPVCWEDVTLRGKAKEQASLSSPLSSQSPKGVLYLHSRVKFAASRRKNLPCNSDYFKNHYTDKTLVKISQILSLNERKTKVLCGHVVKFIKIALQAIVGRNSISAFLLLRFKKKKKIYSFRGTQCAVSEGRGHWHLSTE